ncbi:MAG: hypothetical protein A2Z12_08920 [Actinobacteria bacterium RBG_16_68_21]|nr:MAG: hypothetical protein A2Z12_08920 [Actinobacteria bacterium RBG_16_68_21]
MDEGTTRYVSVAKLGDPGVANIAVAMLQSAGIPARAHGEALGPYRMTVGEMAITEIWVPACDVDDALEVLAESTPEPPSQEPVHTGALADPAALPMRLLAAVTLGALGWAVLRFVMRVF